MKIPFVDLSAQARALKADIFRRFEEVWEQGQFILGPQVAEFEERFAAYCGTRFAVGVANGTEALHLAVRALGIGPGDEVITAANSFAATPLAILYAGATPVFVDVREDDYNLDPELVEAAITPRTKAIIPVHLYGQPARMDALMAIARRHNLRVIEDAAQAHGAEVAGQRCGSFGDIGCFSFYPGKNLGAYGDGGAVVTNDPELAEHIRLLRNYGQRRKNEYEFLGFNCRLDTLQACVLLAKMEHIEDWTERRRQVAQWYREELEGHVQLPQQRDDVRHVYHLFVIQHPNRDALVAHLETQGIGSGIHYPHPLPAAKPFAHCPCHPADHPVARRAAQRIVSLPMYPEMTREQVRTVAQTIRDFQPAEVGV
ncbi:MAG: DegT/DnrJ/EryC1/StrS family aminotransferase [Planctomycetota bacterium]|nr:MAG: DegT/DnrJ/EryC1/StrS family aminotransferase [Planctomycetota bacterium]